MGTWTVKPFSELPHWMSLPVISPPTCILLRASFSVLGAFLSAGMALSSAFLSCANVAGSSARASARPTQRRTRRMLRPLSGSGASPPSPFARIVYPRPPRRPSEKCLRARPEVEADDGRDDRFQGRRVEVQALLDGRQDEQVDDDDDRQ